MPPQGARPPATSYTRPAPSRGKRVERAGRVANQCLGLRTRVPAGGTRNRERPCRAASSVLRTPHATNCRLRAPATSYTRPAPSRGKWVERAGRVARCLRTRVPMGGTRGRESLHNLRALLRCTLHFYNTSTHASVSTQKSRKDTRGRAESLLFSPPLSLLSCGLIGLPALAPSSRRWTWQASSRTDWRCRQRPQHRVWERWHYLSLIHI